LNPDERPTSDEIDILMKSDVIYLAGGNTYTFLHLLRRSGLLPHLKAFAKSGGVLAGLSAGAILLTPSIGLAGIPQYDPDENEVGLRSARQLKALGLVEFEFSPHHSNDPRREKELLQYSRKIRKPVLSARDGSGVVIEGEEIHVYGFVRLYGSSGAVQLNSKLDSAIT
jgi:dipeptidase E